MVEFGLHSVYRLFAVTDDGGQEVVAEIPVDHPAYMHSFAMTERYLALVEFPLVVSALALKFSGRPFIENYHWKPERGLRFHVVDKATGRVVTTARADATFAFHHVNAFEQNGDVFVDIAAYPDNSIIDDLFLHHLRAGDPVSPAELRRYRLPAGGSTATYERLSSESIELPRLNYKRSNTKDYCYTYGVGAHRPGDFTNQLVKVDVRERTAKVWRDENCYVGEPVFVAAPDAAAEDDGIVLSVVLNASQGNSFLLVLDAASFTELARAEAPHHIPFGFHGQFFDE